MSTTLVRTELEAPPDLHHGGPPFEDRDGGGDEGGGGETRRYDRYQTAVWVLFIPIVMLFVGLTSAMVVRKGLSDDWVPIEVPRILFLNTFVLLASSVTIERARRTFTPPIDERFKTWLWWTAALGVMFVAGQLAAWRQLASQGVYLATNPSSAFFYILTATHGIHLVGGMVALTYLALRMLRGEFGPNRRSALKATAVYWHFMDALWIYLVFLLIFWR